MKLSIKLVKNVIKSMFLALFSIYAKISNLNQSRLVILETLYKIQFVPEFSGLLILENLIEHSFYKFPFTRTYLPFRLMLNEPFSFVNMSKAGQ